MCDYKYYHYLYVDLGIRMARAAGALHVALRTAEPVVAHDVAAAGHVQALLQRGRRHEDLGCVAPEALQVQLAYLVAHRLDAAHVRDPVTQPGREHHRHGAGEGDALDEDQNLVAYINICIHV